MNGTRFDNLMKQLATTSMTRTQALRGLAASAVVLVGLPTLGAWPVHAWEDREQELQRVLTTLRADIATYVSPRLQEAFLAQLDAVEGLLLPAVQSAREAPRKACAAVRILTALRHEAETAATSDTFKHDYNFGIVIADIDMLLPLIPRSGHC